MEDGHICKFRAFTSVSSGGFEKYIDLRLVLMLISVQRQDNFIAPKKPYSFDAMLDDILEFSAIMLVENGRISMWMPTANDEDVELSIPSHEWMELVSVCVQPFNRCMFDICASLSEFEVC